MAPESRPTNDAGLTHFEMRIAGAATSAVSGQRIDVVCPSDGSIFGTIPRGGAEDVDRAVAAARAVFENGSWRSLSDLERGRVMIAFSKTLMDYQEELAALEARDVGKPMTLARADVVALARYFEFYGTAIDKFAGENIPTATGFMAITAHEPHGVVAAILPWNYPAQMFGRVAAPALAVGNSLVLKPAEDACLSILRIAELAEENGFPRGLINIVTGTGIEAGAPLAGHPGVDFVTFTGSPEVGTEIQKLAASHRVGCTLELGGKSPHVVFADADLDAAVPVIMKAIVANSGQTCVAGSRVLVERSIADQLSSMLAKQFKALCAGPHWGSYDMGALVNEKQKARVVAMIDRAKEVGVPVLAEGAVAADAPTSGFYVAPTLFGPAPRDAEIATKEVFGPVLSLLTFEDEDDAVKLANGTEYGLSAAVWTRDLGRALRLSRAIQCGQVFVNTYGAGGGVEFPFGGMKQSGHGREKGLQALREFSALKTVIIAHG